MNNLSVLKFLSVLFFFFSPFNIFSQSYISKDGTVLSPWLYIAGGIYNPDVATTATFNSSDYNQSITSNLEDEFNLPSSPTLFYFKAIACTRSHFVFTMYKINKE